jgi:DNA-directed RNA polymerase subunit RPC12/RpoP
MLVDKYSNWVKTVQALGVPMLAYHCPSCSESLEALQPPEGEDPWDSVIQCPYCERKHYRVARNNGEVDVWPL